MTQAELIARLTSFSARSDLSADMPTFISLADDRIRRDIRVSAMLQSDTLTVPDTGSVLLPGATTSTETSADDRFLGFKSVSFSSAGVPVGGAELNYMPPDLFHEERINSAAFSGVVPTGYFTIEGPNLLILPNPGAGNTTELRVTYWQALNRLESSDDTNWVSINATDVYLTAALAELHGFLFDDIQEGKWNAKYLDRVESLNRVERRRQRSGPHIRRPRQAI